MVFPRLVEYIVMLDSRDEQVRAMVEKNTGSGFLPPDRLQVFFQQRFVTPCLLDSPRRNGITRDGLNVRVSLLCQLVERHLI